MAVHRTRDGSGGEEGTSTGACSPGPLSLQQELARELDLARRYTLWFAAGLSDEQARAAVHPELSPLGWHLGHIAWQEECWVLRKLAGRKPIDGRLDGIYDSFRGEKATRSTRIPPVRDILSYAERVREQVLSVLEKADLSSPEPLLRDGYVFRFLANHERQHTETMGVVSLLSRRRIEPIPWMRSDDSNGTRVVADWVRVPEAVFQQGGEDPDGWDNERPARRVEVPAFTMSRHLVDNGAWMEFIEAGGYHDRRLWSPEGLAWQGAAAVEAPLHWQQDPDGRWCRWTLLGLGPVEPSHPVSHIGWFEAEAFARFAGASLPTESQWERAAGWDEALGRRLRWPFGDRWAGPLPANLGMAVGDTSPCGAFPGGKSPLGLADMAGNVWEWCSSAFEAYPGFQADPYRGYSEPWFGEKHRVLRGGCWLSWPTQARTGFRNWFEPHVRWFPTGVRLVSQALAP